VPWCFAATAQRHEPSASSFDSLTPLQQQSGAMPSFRTTRRVPFTPRQMFDLVGEVERYPEFLPLCEALVVRRREREGDLDVLIADMTVGYKAIRETFTTRVRLDAVRCEVDAAGVSGAMGPFRQLENRWRFGAAPGGCEVDFFIAYEFSSTMLRMLVGSLFDRAFRRYARAFEERAHAVYGAGDAPATHAAS
jgi:coenzyme Q-binding protein COQ10